MPTPIVPAPRTENGSERLTIALAGIGVGCTLDGIAVDGAPGEPGQPGGMLGWIDVQASLTGPTSLVPQSAGGQ